MRAAAGALMLVWLAGAAAPPDADRVRAAKTLFFDRKYVEAREAWQAVLAGAKGPDAEAASYWVARCSENLGERERALKEYGDYLTHRPQDSALAEEARTSRVGLAAQLYKAGKREHLPVLQEALADPSRTVRYYAALQLAGLGPAVGQAAVPVLKGILAQEKDEDLVDRARLALLKIGPDVLAQVESEVRDAGERPGAPRREASWVRVRILKKGQAKPAVQINLPVALAELVFKSLPDDAREELQKKGYESDTFWEKLRKLGPTQIIDIVGEDGDRVQIWLE